MYLLARAREGEEMETLPVIIIGAGLAGLGAAYTLARAGVETLVLEQR